MVAKSIASQLQALKSFVQADSEPVKRPFTRPSVLHDPKEAADVDLDTIFSVALSGLDALEAIDDRFKSYRDNLFSIRGKELDRELMGKEENNGINTTICSYLKLLSGHLLRLSAFRTLEYLIRRFKVHVYNMEDLILCALPYHDTPHFVRIVQLIDLGNTRWKFLDAVKVSGAPPPRNVIVQQCVRDLGVMNIICDYAASTKKFQPSSTVMSFSVTVVIEVLGSVGNIDSKLVENVLPFVRSGLQTRGEGTSDHKAGSLMIIGILANKVALSSDTVKSLVRHIVELALAEAKDSADLQMSQMAVMALINIVQLQSIQTFPKKAMDILKCRDLPGILSELSRRFNTEKFLAILLDSMIEHSKSDNLYNPAVISIIETVPIKSIVDHVVSKLLNLCLSRSQDTNASESLGTWVKQIMVAIDKKYPNELRRAFNRFLDDPKVQKKGGGRVYETLCRMLDGSLGDEISESRIWFALENPRAEIRRATLESLDNSGVLKGEVVDAVIRRLHDDDLSVVRAALSLKRLLIGSSHLLEGLQDVFRRCIRILESGDSTDVSSAHDTCLSCLELALTCHRDQNGFLQELASMIFPLLLVSSKTKVLNLKALTLAGEIGWPFYQNLSGLGKKSREEASISVNVEIVSRLAVVLLAEVEEYFPWLVKCCSASDLSNTLLFLVLAQSFIIHKNMVQFCSLFKTCFTFLKTEWSSVQQLEDLLFDEQLDEKFLDGSCINLLDQLHHVNLKLLNARILILTLWKLLQAFISRMPSNDALDNGEWLASFRELFTFFAESGKNKLLKHHLLYLVAKCKTYPLDVFTELVCDDGASSAIKVESLNALACITSSMSESTVLQLLAGFPLVLVPLSSEIRDLRIAAMKYVEGLFSFWSSLQISGRRNGNNEPWGPSIDRLLKLLVQQKKLIISDREYLSSLLASALSSTSQSPVAPKERLDKSSVEGIMAFIVGSAMKLPAYCKLRILSLLKDVGGMIMLVKDSEFLLSNLLEQLHGLDIKTRQKLSNYDVDILCLLLEICCNSLPADVHRFEDHLLKAIKMNDNSRSDPAAIRPCATVLRKLNDHLNGSLYSRLTPKTQELFLYELVLLHQNSNSEVQNAARDTLLHLDIGSSLIVHLLNELNLSEGDFFKEACPMKKKSKKHCMPDGVRGQKDGLRFLSSLLDVVLLKKDLNSRTSLVKPLFQLLKKAYSSAATLSDNSEKWIQDSSGVSRSYYDTICYIQQTILIILEEIIGSLSSANSPNDLVLDDTDVLVLVECAQSTKELPILNHAFSLFTSIAKSVPAIVLDKIPEILIVICKSTITQEDSHSKCVFEDLISAVVPCWLSNGRDSTSLLQIFVDIMSDVAKHRRLPVVVHLLRSLGEKRSLCSLFLLLLQSQISRIKLSFPEDGEHITSLITSAQTEWEYMFSVQLCQQYSCLIWLPSLVMLLEQLQSRRQHANLFMEMLLAIKFVLEKLHDPEYQFKLENEDDTEMIQETLGKLLQQIICCLHLVDSKRKMVDLSSSMKRELKELLQAAVSTITKGMIPSAFFKAISALLGNAERNVIKKALRLLSDVAREFTAVNPNKNKKSNVFVGTSWNNLDGCSLECFGDLGSKILELVDQSQHNQDHSVELAGVSALEVLACRFPPQHPISSNCLAVIKKTIMSDDLAVSSSGLRTVGALVNVLGTKSLSELPGIMENLLKRSKVLPSESDANNDSAGSSVQKQSVMLSILITLEALVEQLGSFLNPYLGDILELMVLNPSYISESNQKLKTKSEAVRRLLSETIPVRLALPPMVKLYPEAVRSGDLSLKMSFEMLASFVSRMDRTTVSNYHGKIFDLCLMALDLRRQCLPSIKTISVVEGHVIEVIITLTMKLTETMFKPLFIRCIEWAESSGEEHEDTANIDRAISFYGLVNKLAEKNRSLFVPYFKYLVKDCIRHLTDDGQNSAGHSRKKKKAKLGSEYIALRKWHVRAVVLSSLHKCFLYDTGSNKFLDSTNFQELLKPIVSQLILEPPASLGDYTDIPSVEEVDNLLVSCIGQMAVTAGNDLLWKHLNSEVLMQTKSEGIPVRSKLLGLKTVKYLVDNLKEEFLVLLSETISSLAELLEDVELSVKTLAQEILRDLESLSGENLKDYL